jgi:hypothetical protein
LGVEFRKTGLTDALPAAEQHGQAINHLIRNFALEYDGMSMIIDSDVFPLRPFDISKCMDGFDLCVTKGFAGGKEKSKTVFFCHPCFVVMNTPLLPDHDQIDFSPGNIGGLCADTGAQMYHYFMSHPSLPIRWLPLIEESHMAQKGFGDVLAMQKERMVICNVDTSYRKGYFCGDLIEGGFYHVRNVSNWYDFQNDWHKANSMIIQDYLVSKGIMTQEEASKTPHVH